MRWQLKGIELYGVLHFSVQISLESVVHFSVKVLNKTRQDLFQSCRVPTFPCGSVDIHSF